MTGTIIKAGQLGTVLARLSRVDLADHLRDAQSVVTNARRQAEQIIAQARDEAAGIVAESRARVEEQCESARREGAQRGFAEGREAGEQAGREQAFAEGAARYAQQVASSAQVLGEAQRAFDERHEALLSAARQQILDFAVSAAAKLTVGIGAIHRGAAIANLERALAMIGSSADMVIRVNPSDLESMETYAAGAVVQLTGPRHARVVVDPGIAPGGCVVEAGATVVDATLKTQVEQMVAALVGTCEEDGLVH